MMRDTEGEEVVPVEGSQWSAAGIRRRLGESGASDGEGVPGSKNNDLPVAEWYCVKARPKGEHIAGAALKQFEDVEVYCPRIRFHMSTRRGRVWFTEALFPGYLFARFIAETRLRAVSHANAVSKLLRFGDRYATLPPELIDDIKRQMQGEDIWTIANHDTPEIGSEAEIATGPLRGLHGVVTNLLSGGQRVQMLMEMFGELNKVEVRSETLLSSKSPRDSLSSELNRNKVSKGALEF